MTKRTVAGLALLLLLLLLLLAAAPPVYADQLTGYMGAARGDGAPTLNASVAPLCGIYGQDGVPLVCDASTQGEGNVIRRAPPGGVATTVAGNFTNGSAAGSGGATNGDGGAATQASLSLPMALAQDADGTIYVGTGPAIRAFTIGGTIRTVALLNASSTVGGLTVGAGADHALYAVDRYFSQILRYPLPCTVPQLDDVEETAEPLAPPDDVAALGIRLAQGAGLVYRLVRGQLVCASPTIVAGTGTSGYVDGPALQAKFYNPFGLATMPNGAILIADQINSRIRLLQGGTVSTLAGGGTNAADGPALTVRLYFPSNPSVAPNGDIYFADNNNYRVRKLAGGMLTTVVGTGTGPQATSPLPCAWSRTLPGCVTVATDFPISPSMTAVSPDGRQLLTADHTFNRLVAVDLTGAAPVVTATAAPLPTALPPATATASAVPTLTNTLVPSPTLVAATPTWPVCSNWPCVAPGGTL